MKEIPLSQGKVALVDDDDFEFLSQWKWCAEKAKKTFYATTRNGGNKIRMHRLLLGITDRSVLADHKDLDGLNNQRYNLREATYSQNNANRMSLKNSTSKYFGVCWSKAKKKWHATIYKNRQYRLGFFDNEEEAALAYNKAAIIIHGEFANLNKVG